MDLFGSYSELVLPFFFIVLMLCLGIVLGFYRQKFLLWIFGDLSLNLSQDIMKQFFGMSLMRQNKKQIHDYFGRLYAVEQLFYRALQHLFFTSIDILFLFISILIMCWMSLKLASIDLIFFVGVTVLNRRYNQEYYKEPE